MHRYPGQNQSIPGRKFVLKPNINFAGELTGLRYCFIALRRIYSSMHQTLLGNRQSVCEAVLVLKNYWEKIPGIDFCIMQNHFHRSF